MSETIPDDIHSTAVRVVNTYHDNYSDRSLYDIVTEALLAERERERLACADMLEAAARGNFLLMPASYRDADPRSLLMAATALREIRSAMKS